MRAPDFCNMRRLRCRYGGRIRNVPDAGLRRQQQWFVWFIQYLKENNLSWGYWPLNERNLRAIAAFTTAWRLTGLAVAGLAAHWRAENTGTVRNIASPADPPPH